MPELPDIDEESWRRYQSDVFLEGVGKDLDHLDWWHQVHDDLRSLPTSAPAPAAPGAADYEAQGMQAPGTTAAINATVAQYAPSTSQTEGATADSRFSTSSPVAPLSPPAPEPAPTRPPVPSGSGGDSGGDTWLQDRLDEISQIEAQGNQPAGQTFAPTPAFQAYQQAQQRSIGPRPPTFPERMGDVAGRVGAIATGAAQGIEQQSQNVQQSVDRLIGEGRLADLPGQAFDVLQAGIAADQGDLQRGPFAGAANVYRQSVDMARQAGGPSPDVVRQQATSELPALGQNVGDVANVVPGWQQANFDFSALRGALVAAGVPEGYWSDAAALAAQVGIPGAVRAMSERVAPTVGEALVRAGEQMPEAESGIMRRGSAPGGRLTAAEQTQRIADRAANDQLFDVHLALSKLKGISPDVLDASYELQGRGQAGMARLPALAQQYPEVGQAMQAAGVSAPSAGASGITSTLSDVFGNPTTTQRAIDTAAGVAGAAYGATAGSDENATPLERAGNAALYGSAAALGARALRELPGQVADLTRGAGRESGVLPVRDYANERGELLAKAERAIKQAALPGFEDLLRAAPVDERPRAVAALATANNTVGTYGRLMLLLSPTTHLANIMGNVATMPWQFTERLTAPLVEPLWHAAGKTGEARYAGEAGALARGWWTSLNAAGTNFLDVLKHGDEALTQSITGATAAKSGVQRALETGYRPLSAMDAFFKTLAEGGELYTLAYRTAKGRGLAGDELGQEVTRLVQQPTPQMVQRMEQAGKYLTYTQAMDRTGKALEAVAKNLPGAQFLMPFYRTPYNALKYDLERSPFGALSVGAAALDKNATSGELADRTVRALMGSVLAAGLTKYAMDGNITGALPTNPIERDAWQAEGKTPWSIRLGNSWWQLSKLPGLGATVAVAGQLADTANRLQQPDASYAREAGTFALTMAQVLAQKPLLDTLSGLMGAINDPANAGSFMERLGASALSQALPGSSALGYVENSTDPNQREARGIGQRIQSRIPGVVGWLTGGRVPTAEQLPVRRDAFGRPLSRIQTGAEAAVNPLRRSAIQPGIRRYEGSPSAAQDTRIAQALDRVHQAFRAGRNPDPADMRLYDRYVGTESVDWKMLRSEERRRQAAQKAS